MNNVQNVVAVLSADELAQVVGGAGLSVDFEWYTQAPLPPPRPK
jgi:bacteriocin-like protein